MKSIFVLSLGLNALTATVSFNRLFMLTKFGDVSENKDVLLQLLEAKRNEGTVQMEVRVCV